MSKRNGNCSSSRNEGQSRAGGSRMLAHPGHRCRSDVDTTACNQSVLMCLMHVCVCVCVFQAGSTSPGVIHGTHPIRHSACATHVFLFNLLVFSSSAITRTLPAIFFPTQDKRITDVRGWEHSLPATSPFLPRCDLSATTFALSPLPPRSSAPLKRPIPCPVCGDAALHPCSADSHQIIPLV